MPSKSLSVPLINIDLLAGDSADQQKLARQLYEACKTYGFFYLIGHGVEEELGRALEQLSHTFFARSLEEKLKIRMELGGRAWRGYFPVGGELTSGQPDLKEGLYFGAELDAEDPRVQAGLPLHGQNLFPASMPAFRTTVLKYMDALTQLGHQLMEALALSLGLERDYFASRYTADPLTLFRIFHYPPDPSLKADAWGVGEHTDYGVLTILKQDQVGGLQIKTQGQWLEAPYVPASFVCNIGDMLDRMTGGLYRSTPHRVRNRSGHGRLSFPFFFDPHFDAQIQPIELTQPQTLIDDQAERWDGASVHAFDGTYGDYILAKVGKVFPELKRKVED